MSSSFIISQRSRLYSSERIRIYPTHAAMTGTRYHFCHTIISRVALAKPPSRNHPSNPPRCRVSILKITISRRSPSFFQFLSSSDFLSFGFHFGVSDALRFLLSSVSVLGNGPDVWRNTRNPIATLRIAGTSSSFLLIYETWERKERKIERTTKWEIKGERERNVKFWLILLKFQENKSSRRRCTQLASCVLERLHFAETSYVEVKHL